MKTCFNCKKYENCKKRTEAKYHYWVAQECDNYNHLKTNTISLKEFKEKTKQIISELKENNERFNRIQNNEQLSLEEYKRRWGRLFADKMGLQKKLNKLRQKTIVKEK